MQSLKDEIIELLEKDKKFRYAVAGLLGYKEILERIVSLEEGHQRLEERQQRLEERITSLEERVVAIEERLVEIEERLVAIEERQQRLEERVASLEERVISLEERVASLEERVVAIEERLVEIEERLVAIEERQQRLEEEFRRLSYKVEVTIGSMGRRWGSDLERMVLNIFKEVLEKEGIEPGEVRKLRFKDEDGKVTGVKGRIVDVDILIKDSKLYVIEVKSRAELDHVEHLYDKVKFVEKFMGRQADRVLIVAVNVDKEAYERAEEMGIDVICGHVID